MNTIIEKVDPQDSERNAALIKKAAAVLIQGGLVAFPTETVYGLGANGFDSAAVQKIYEAKGRPSDNPLIMHIDSLLSLEKLARDIPDAAYKLADAFWPGPLTMILKKQETVPLEATGKLDTVAVRFPEHEIAQLLIKEAGVPIAAPSANLSGKPSPTKASHVIFDLSGKIDMIIDGGDARFGLESTIVDVTDENIQILRPGSITKEMIEECLGCGIGEHSQNTGEPPKAPGMKYTHYSPEAKVTIVTGSRENVIQAINRLIRENPGVKTGVLATDETVGCYESEALALSAGPGGDASAIGSNLFKLLRKFDYYGIEQIYAQGMPEEGVAAAVMNRLKKAAGYDILELKEE